MSISPVVTRGFGTGNEGHIMMRGYGGYVQPPPPADIVAMLEVDHGIKGRINK